MKHIFMLQRKKCIIIFLSLIMLSISGLYYYHHALSAREPKVQSGIYLGAISMEHKSAAEVWEIVEEESLLSLKRPRNAFIDPRTGQLLREVYGEMIDVQATVALIMNSDPDTVCNPVKVVLEPEITVEVYRNLNEYQGSFTTWYGNGARAENIRLAASFVNNYILAPGEVFSFNRVTGHSKPGRGYKLAPIIVGENVIPGYGGGVCQVSSTLYNAVMYAGLEIVERFPHSRPIGYVPAGRDATVSEHLDFKFRNNTNDFVLIKGGAGGGCVSFEIYSAP